LCRQDRSIVEPGSAEANERSYLSLEHIESESGKILREPEDAPEDEGKSTTFAFDERHVLYGKLRPYLNKVALPHFRGRSTTEAIPLLPADGVDREFLAWLLRRKETVAAAMREKTGSRMPRANMDDLLSLEVPVPPLTEQRRIAAKLREKLEAVARAKKAAEERVAACESLAPALWGEVFLRGSAEGWRTARLGDVCEMNPRRPALDRRDDEPTTFVQMSAVGEDEGAIVRPEVKPFGAVKKATLISVKAMLFLPR
jgi:type I restriction enzyme S subunit